MVSIGRKVVRAVFQGMTIGLFGGAGLYLTAIGVNTLAAATVVNPTGLLLMGIGGALTAAVGIELSGDIREDAKKTSTEPTET